ncbi:MAG TPA: cell surface protein [Rubrivivax sp.]|nr:cell surface protein [Rubrivivax sp.]
MKRTLVAQCAAAVLTGAAFVGANAAVVAPAAGAIDTVATATQLVANKDGIGHIVVVPYYSAASGNDTYLSITNTDMRNGKAVKVRFRGASNSDDVFDFTLLMSPGDVWTGTVTKDATSGKAKLLTGDKSCTIPNAIDGSTFVTGRLAPYQSADAQAKETLEGYVEILNMADIYPNAVPALAVGGSPTRLPAVAPAVNNPLFIATKHVNGVPPGCGETTPAIAALANDPTSYSTPTDATSAVQMGLDVPTGGLTATWTIINVPLATSYSGLGDAVEAINAATGLPGWGNVVFSPQLATPVAVAAARLVTADPLLRGGVPDSENAVLPAVVRGTPVLPTAATSYVAPAMYDFPDLSTPYLQGSIGSMGNGVATRLQASLLTDAYAVTSVMNEFVTDVSLLAKTDWVFSSATRRYNVARNYGTSAATASTVFTDLEFDDANTAGGVTVGGATTANRYAVSNTTAEGNLICVTGVGTAAGLTAPVPNNKYGAVNADREETFVGSTSQFVISPGTPTAPLTICGEVSVLTFNNASGGGALGAQLTKKDLTGTNVNGWARLSTPGLAGIAPGTVSGRLGLPIVGASFMQLTNGAVAAGTSGNYGLTFPHRTTRY